MPSVRFLVLSDTHDSAFSDHSALPKADVVLHCGDLTMIGGLSNFRTAIENLARCDAELKIVIAGNHDVSLDQKWWMENLDDDGVDDPDEPTKARDLFTRDEAIRRGIRFVDEGTHSFKLEDGTSFTIYASPYTPAFNGYAFSYDSAEDRFNGEAENPIPAGVDIVMTHGPPFVPDDRYRLDANGRGAHCGCSKLWEAITRVKPRMHCFGHIHEGYGAQLVSWKDMSETKSSFGGLVDVESSHDDRLLVARGGDDTLLINAALMNHGEQEHNRPWVVDMDL